uniref:Uncharacterized protein n=1 Tax=Salix viminalis TaxID=40686 RepID=A0A6N2K8P5_SALVM
MTTAHTTKQTNLRDLGLAMIDESIGADYEKLHLLLVAGENVLGIIGENPVLTSKSSDILLEKLVGGGLEPRLSEIFV